MKLSKTFAERIACSHDDRFIRAARAIAAGNASDVQQKLFLAWIVDEASKVNETTFWPGEPAAMAYLEGRRSIAADVVSLIKAKPKDEKDR